MKRFDVDASARARHGALLDAELLAQVYLELMGGRQAGLAFGGGPAASAAPGSGAPREAREARPHAATAEGGSAPRRLPRPSRRRSDLAPLPRAETRRALSSRADAR